MDGSATLINCKSTGATHGKAPQYHITIDAFVHPAYGQQFLFSNLVDFYEKIMSYNRELAN